MSNKKQQTTKFITKDILKSSIMGAFQKLDPRYMSKNPKSVWRCRCLGRRVFRGVP